MLHEICNTPGAVLLGVSRGRTEGEAFLRGLSRRAKRALAMTTAGASGFSLPAVLVDRVRVGKFLKSLKGAVKLFEHFLKFSAYKFLDTIFSHLNPNGGVIYFQLIFFLIF